MNKALLFVALAIFGIVLVGSCGVVEDATGTGDDDSTTTTTTTTDADGNTIFTTDLVWDDGNWDENNWQSASEDTTN